jgi:Fur family ferric uptake transcriptional regulator
MKPIHSQEKEQFKKLFEQEKLERFEDHFKVLEIFLQTESHLTAEEFRVLLAKNGYDFDIQFVRAALEQMCHYGFARENRFDNGLVRYEHHHLGQHHDHMVCTKCRRIFEFRDEPLENRQLQVAASHGFHMLQHRMEIYGICADCLKERIASMPLVSAKPGEVLVISDLTGGAGARMRLMTMGLRLGDQIEVITNNRQGQLVVAADFKRYAIGRGLAQKIIVEPQKR